MSAGPAPRHREAGQRQLVGGTLPSSNWVITPACRHVEFAVGQRGAEGGRGGDDPGEPEEVVLERLQLGRGHVLVHGGRTANTLARLQEAQARLVVLALVEVADPGDDPAEVRGDLGGRTPRLRRRPAAAPRADLSVEQVEHDRPASGTGHGRVGQRGT